VDIRNYYNINLDWFKCYLPINYHDNLTEDHEIYITSTRLNSVDQHYIEFVVSIRDESNTNLFVEKVRSLRRDIYEARNSKVS
jgi:hypothetical protein